jgi:hypothetical protein
MKGTSPNQKPTDNALICGARIVLNPQRVAAKGVAGKNPTPPISLEPLRVGTTRAPANFGHYPAVA